MQIDQSKSKKILKNCTSDQSIYEAELIKIRKAQKWNKNKKLWVSAFLKAIEPNLFKQVIYHSFWDDVGY